MGLLLGGFVPAGLAVLASWVLAADFQALPMRCRMPGHCCFILFVVGVMMFSVIWLITRLLLKNAFSLSRRAPATCCNVSTTPVNLYIVGMYWHVIGHINT